jgi:hypothetical protein
LLWAKPQNFYALPNQMAVDRNGFIYVQYSNGGGGFFTKYDSSGKVLPCSFTPGLNPRFDQSNNLFMNNDFELRKFDYSGNLLWSKYAESGSLLEVDDSGNSYLLYNEIKKYDPSGNLLWTTLLTNACNARLRVENDNLYIVYTTGPADNWGSPNVLEKLDPNNGKVIWSVDVPFSADLPVFPHLITSDRGMVYFSGYTPEYLSAILVAVEDKSYNPVVTSLFKSQKKSGQLRVAPNPGTGRFRLSWDSEAPATSVIEVYDGSGRIVSYVEINSEITEHELDLSFLEKGLYIVELKTPGATPQVSRLLIQ